MVYRQSDDMMASTNRGRRRTFKKKSKALSVPQQKVVNKMITSRLRNDPEKKWYDRSQPGVTVGPASGAHQQVLTHVGQGTSNQARIGSEITPVYLGIRGTIQAQFTFSPAPAQPWTNTRVQVRIMVVRWKPDDLTSQPTLDNAVAGYLLQNPNPFSYYADNITQDFEVLYDAKHVVVNNPNNSESNQIFNVSIPAKKLKTIQFDASVTSGNNHIYLLATSDSPTGGDNPVIKYESRLKFTDL